MNYKEAEINLSVFTQGCLALRGKYEAHQKVDDKGNKVFSIERNEKTNLIERNPVFVVKTISLPKEHECSHQTKLNNSFVLWALSEDSRPKDVSAKYWSKMTDKNKIHFHVKKYVNDQFGDVPFKYTILE